jgi:predicted homoserine dehydrogenase-like protein
MPNKSTIIKVKKNSSGDITAVMLGDESVHSIEEAIDMAKNGYIESVNVGKAKNGREYLRSNPNGTEGDNLDTKPTF